MDQVSEYKLPLLHPWIRVDGFEQFERKGLHFPIDILVKRYHAKHDTFKYEQYLNVFYVKRTEFAHNDYWVHPFLAEKIWDDIKWRTRLIGYRPSLYKEHLNTCSLKEADIYEKQLFGDI